MKIRDVVELENRLLPSLSPELAVKEGLCFLSPVRGTLRAFHFEASPFHRREFHVTAFFLPLCVPHKRLQFIFGRPVGARWRINELGCEEALLKEMQKELPRLCGMKTPDGVARALEPFVKAADPHSLEIYAYSLIRAGQPTAAANVLDSLLKQIDRTAPWQAEIALRSTDIRAKLPKRIDAAQEQLLRWESESIANLGLAEYHESEAPGG